MLATTLARAAGTATVLGPLSHFVIWTRLDLDSQSHKILALANLFVVLPPVALWLRGSPILWSVLISLTVNICYAVSLTASIGLYRIYLHPLRRFPGPFWARFSVFWKVKNFQESDFQPYRLIDNLHQQYGDVVRLAPRQLSINDPAAFQAIYGSQSQCQRMKDLEHLRKNLQSLSDPHEHKARRKVWDHGLSTKACQSYLPRIHDMTLKLCNQLAAYEGKSVSINDWCHFYTFDIMGDLGFGRSYGQLETGRGHPAITKVRNFLKAGVIALQIFWVVNFLSMIPGLEDPVKDLHDWAERLLDERARNSRSEKNGDNERDLMSYVEESSRVVDTRWPMTHKDLIEDCVTLQIAGSDTSYSVLSNLCYYLANYPELQQRIREEIIATFQEHDSTNPQWSKLSSIQSCPYLDATVDEVMRLMPPVPMGTVRQSPNHEIEIAGHIIPAKTIVSCPIWTLQRDERCFKLGNEFIPERWLDSSHLETRTELILDKRGFVPFLTGPMNCAGKYFACMEIKVCVAHLLNRFTIAFPDDQAQDQSKEARKARDIEHNSRMQDYLTQCAPETKVCFQPIRH